MELIIIKCIIYVISLMISSKLFGILLTEEVKKSFLKNVAYAVAASMLNGYLLTSIYMNFATLNHDEFNNMVNIIQLFFIIGLTILQNMYTVKPKSK